MTRLLFSPDLPLPGEPNDLPLWLRPTPVGGAMGLSLHVTNRASAFVLYRLRLGPLFTHVLRSIRPQAAPAK